MDVSTASPSAGNAVWPPAIGPNSLSGNQEMLHARFPPPPVHLGLHPRMGPAPQRLPIRPFFVREIYKNGFLKRLAPNEKKSSALSKLMRSDRYWVVFSVHDLGAEQVPFLELWHEPTEVATKPPQFMFPLAACQHISPSLVPADNEWTFVINFETVAIRFSCNLRQTMEEWVECIRMKLCEMGILNPKGNLYSKVPLLPCLNKSANNSGVGRNPMSPLPEPPSNVIVPEDDSSQIRTQIDTTAIIESVDTMQPRTRTSIVDISDTNNQPFTTSIYLNQLTQQSEACQDPAPNVIPLKSHDPVVLVTTAASTSSPSTSAAVKTSTIDVPTLTTPSTDKSKWSVYLSKNKPARHVTVIPINNNHSIEIESKPPTSSPIPDKDEGIPVRIEVPDEETPSEHLYDAIFEIEEVPTSTHSTSKTTGNVLTQHRRERRRQQSPVANAPPPLPSPYETILAESRPEVRRSRPNREGNQSPPQYQSGPQFKEPVSRRCSDRRESRHSSGQKQPQHTQLRTRKKSQRSSSLGPLLDDTQLLMSSNLAQRSANTNSLESIDSNPRRAVAKNSQAHHHYPHQARELGAIPRRPLQAMASLGQIESGSRDSGGLMGSPPRGLPDFQRPLLVIPGTNPAPHTPHPPHIPLPGLSCQLSVGLQQNELQQTHTLRPSLREQQVHRLRQEIAHPAGVRLTLRKRDCQGSLALVEFFGCLWVAGWKQRDFPVLYNAFHIGDQVLSVAGIPVKTASEFNKLVKVKSHSISTSANSLTPNEVLHVEIVVRRLPFAQVFHLKREVEGQPLGIVTNGNTGEIQKILPASPAAQHGMTSKIRSFDGQSLVPWVLTEINGRPINLLGKDGEAGDRLQALGRDVSVLLQPADIVNKIKKQLKSQRNYKDFLLG